MSDMKGSDRKGRTSIELDINRVRHQRVGQEGSDINRVGHQ